MYRLECAYNNGIDESIFLERYFHSLQGAKIVGTRECKKMSACNGISTRYVISQVENVYSVGELVYKKSIN